MSQLESFASIYQRASDRKGGDESLESLLSGSLTEDEIGQYKDAELLSEMSKKVFQSGFVWRIVDNKWPAYQEAFFNFDPSKVLMLSHEQLQERASDPNLIRHMKKTMAIYDNALMTHDIALEHGSLAEYIGRWPAEEITELWAVLKRRGTRLGGNTGPYFLRAIGKDTFLLTGDVQGYLTSHGLVDFGFSSKSGLKQTQGVFNAWQQESGRNLADISRVLACSVGDNRI
ncbi:DNA-3-methyladenine glycosylase I [Shewanella sp. D64]|uniref:DNA-3-methyladenine glycosylase I n=1 Tax=unclassified Shewanella TaxID=196818 RepID=UPI0022BA45C5|nr:MULTISPECIES: DNA-3-methyladenine glycosylase I [unclassified Shewanella]MEC4725885.1 DNA-3-methyladenine glycosylase I [Shewanella sp. D64]MEC4737140.1 DNA-3-methyladenine glycosylase I [Shewanella sp. E94]WBJ95668.1 DNA-3-methyladenine glycosylase I [Shewanella sp. MTB7]